MNGPFALIDHMINFRLTWKQFPFLGAQSSCYNLEGDLSPVMFKEIFHDSLKILNLQDLYGKPFKCDWLAIVVFLIQILLILAAVAIATIEI